MAHTSIKREGEHPRRVDRRERCEDLGAETAAGLTEGGEGSEGEERDGIQ